MSFGPAWTTIPLVPATRIEPTPAPQSIVMALVMVTTPKPAPSRQSISPPAAVLEIAPANVLHGAVREHGLTSSPTPDTQVLEAWALAVIANANVNTAADRSLELTLKYFISLNFLFRSGHRRNYRVSSFLR